jgi:hypothetical protein
MNYNNYLVCVLISYKATKSCAKTRVIGKNDILISHQSINQYTLRKKICSNNQAQTHKVFKTTKYPQYVPSFTINSGWGLLSFISLSKYQFNVNYW